MLHPLRLAGLALAAVLLCGCATARPGEAVACTSSDFTSLTGRSVEARLTDGNVMTGRVRGGDSQRLLIEGPQAEMQPLSRADLQQVNVQRRTYGRAIGMGAVAGWLLYLYVLRPDADGDSLSSLTGFGATLTLLVLGGGAGDLADGPDWRTVCTRP